MNIFLRVLLAVYAFCLSLASLFMMLITFRREYFDSATDYISGHLLENGSMRLVVVALSFLFLVLSVTFLLSGVRTSSSKRAVRKASQLGEISIAIQAIENIVLNACRKMNGIKDSKAYVFRHEDTVSVIAKIGVFTEVNIPALCEDLQTKVKKAIEDSAGIRVQNVEIIVDDIHATYRSRVE